jgi:hypothetical protein
MAADITDDTVGESSNSSLNEPPEDVENDVLWDVAVVEREQLRLVGNKDERLVPSGKGSNANATGGFGFPTTAAGAMGANSSRFWGDGLAAARLRNLMSGDSRRG